MKRFRHILELISLVFFILLTTNASAQDVHSGANYDKRTKISLLTCGPGNESYSLFGHTAIRIVWQDENAQNRDIVVNYGMFSFKQPYFIARFVFGLTDYQMGITSFEDFKAEYEYEQRWVIEQELNLTTHEKQALLMSINENYKPENITYRYNIFYNNCTTKARDIIYANVDGEIKYSESNNSDISFRALCHSKTQYHRWSQFGNDLLLGIKADMPTDKSEQQFLPENLKSDFDKAIIIDKDGNTRKLVATERYIIPKTNVTSADSAAGRSNTDFTSPICIISLIALLLLTASFIEYKRNRIFWGIDAALMTLTGVAGLILFAMVFSQHPTTNINLQILILNPVALAMMFPMVKNERRMKLTWWHKTYTIFIFAGIICGLFQHYAEGIQILAPSLLIRNIVTIYIIKKHQRTRFLPNMRKTNK